MELNYYYPGECPRLEHALSIWDKAYFRYVPIAYVYDVDRMALLLPAGITASWVSNITNRPIEINYDADECDKIHLRINKPPRDLLQVESLKFLAGKDEYAGYDKYPQMVLNLDTDTGKTYIAMAQIAYQGLRTMVIVHSEFLANQWTEKFIKDTDIDSKRICQIAGSPKCLNIIDKPRKYKQYAIFIIKHATIHSFGTNYGWDKVGELFRTLHIGVKIYDEAHKEFANIIHTDCYTNTKYTYYLTATFGRSNTDEMKIYLECFKNIPKFEQKKLPDYGGKPHITYLCIFYMTDPTIMQMTMMKNKYGFNRTAYAKYQLEEDPHFFRILRSLIKKSVVDGGLKTLVLMSTINGIDELADYINHEFPDVKIGIYHSKVKDLAAKDDAKNQQLIISTQKSLGEGADIAGLKVVINTESFKSTIVTEQIIGRLRRPPDGSGCIYIETVDKAFQTLRNQQKTRERFMKKMVSVIKYVKM
jgi:superfamily II DNA or RNA helicase